MDVGDGPDQSEPLDFPDASAARQDAQVAMAELARDKIPGETEAHLAVEIDDENGASVYRAELDFKCRDDDAEQHLDVVSQLPNEPRG